CLYPCEPACANEPASPGEVMMGNPLVRLLKIVGIGVGVLFVGSAMLAGVYEGTTGRHVANPFGESRVMPAPVAPVPASPVDPPYQVLNIKHDEEAGAKWDTYRIVIPGAITKERLEAVAQKERDGQAPEDCGWFFFYRPGTDTQSEYTAGRVLWGPDGEPSNARLHPEMRGQNMAFKTDLSPPPDDRPPPTSTRQMTEETRRRIFFGLNRYASNESLTDEQEYALAAKEFHVTVDQVRDVEMEGGLKHWPMWHKEGE
nr:hypothetical protein [Armatimonadota bacterium]